MHAGSTVESLDFQPRVIGKAVLPVVLLHVAGLLQGVALQRLSRLGDVHVTTYIAETHHLKAVTQNLAHLLQLVRVVGGKYKRPTPIPLPVREGSSYL